MVQVTRVMQVGKIGSALSLAVDGLYDLALKLASLVVEAGAMQTRTIETRNADEYDRLLDIAYAHNPDGQISLAETGLSSALEALHLSLREMMKEHER